MIEILQRYIAACESNLADLLAQDNVDERAVSVTQGMIDKFNLQIEGLLI
tara:strand:+ start:527 stop:676 length:150 start_codon:yes stop_codon:yes gene_type:complete